ncbi:hypothetical protein [Candidatus Leptofilum sp.]|uniref:hypothetical protein n=1 Tax=Candidatus Leptofilum sp. TaxID=3241576 RepID=UPI003B5C213C
MTQQHNWKPNTAVSIKHSHFLTIWWRQNAYMWGDNYFAGRLGAIIQHCLRRQN